MSDDASDADIQSVENFIEGLDGVASVGFTNKEQALEKFRSSTTSDIIDTLDGQNPLPVSYTHLDVYKRQGEGRSLRQRRAQRAVPLRLGPQVQEVSRTRSIRNHG